MSAPYLPGTFWDIHGRGYVIDPAGRWVRIDEPVLFRIPPMAPDTEGAVQLQLVSVAAGPESQGPGWFWSQDEWAEWSNALAVLIPEDDVSRYSNPEGAQEGIISDCLAAYVDERTPAEPGGLRQAIEVEWENGNLDRGAADRLLAVLGGDSS
jgi:hypothetical protein